MTSSSQDQAAAQVRLLKRLADDAAAIGALMRKRPLDRSDDDPPQHAKRPRLTLPTTGVDTLVDADRSDFLERGPAFVPDADGRVSRARVESWGRDYLARYHLGARALWPRVRRDASPTMSLAEFGAWWRVHDACREHYVLERSGSGHGARLFDGSLVQVRAALTVAQAWGWTDEADRIVAFVRPSCLAVSSHAYSSRGRHDWSYRRQGTAVAVARNNLLARTSKSRPSTMSGVVVDVSAGGACVDALRTIRTRRTLAGHEHESLRLAIRQRLPSGTESAIGYVDVPLDGRSVVVDLGGHAWYRFVPVVAQPDTTLAPHQIVDIVRNDLEGST
jgi:hypothetical protein